MFQVKAEAEVFKQEYALATKETQRQVDVVLNQGKFHAF
jgi:hypothetical protein